MPTRVRDCALVPLRRVLPTAIWGYVCFKWLAARRYL